MINVHKSVCHYSYVENICFLVCKVLSSSIDVSVDGSAGPVRETVEEIRHYPKSVMTTLDNAQKLKLPEPSKEKAGFRIGFYYRFFRGDTSLWYFEQVSPSGPSGCFATCRGLPEDSRSGF